MVVPMGGPEQYLRTVLAAMHSSTVLGMDDIRRGLRRQGWLPRTWRREEYQLYGGLVWERRYTARCSGCGRMRPTRSAELHFAVSGAGALRFKMTQLCGDCLVYVESIAYTPMPHVP